MASQVRTQRELCAGLWSMTDSNADNQEAVEKAGGIPLLIALLNDHPDIHRDAAGALKACMLFDAMEDGLSAVYSFFCPEEARRSLGTFCILDTVEHLKLLHLPKFYLGYWIKGSETMAYKIGFSGVEIHQHGTWKAVESSLSAS